MYICTTLKTNSWYQSLYTFSLWIMYVLSTAQEKMSSNMCENGVEEKSCENACFFRKCTNCVCTKVLRKLGGRHMSSLLGSPPTRWSLLTQFMCLVRAKWCINICRSDFNCHPTRVPNVYHMGSQSCEYLYLTR